MVLQSWLQKRRSRRLQVRRRHRRARRGMLPAALRGLVFEQLEERRVLTYFAPVDYAVGTYPYSIVTADFTNDGRLDLAIANSSDNTVGVLVGSDTIAGAFHPMATSPTGVDPRSLAVGDFNHDGNLDVATANANGVGVLLGDGAGAFRPAPSGEISVGAYPQSVAVGDFNGDGLMDLGVVSNVYFPGECRPYCYYGHYESQATVLLGNGLGGFSASKSTFLGYGFHTSALAADLDGDSADDFVTFNAYEALGTVTGYVTVLLGDSSGFLQYHSSIYTGDHSTDLDAGDVDGDGDNDLVTINYYGNSIGVLMGNGSGVFTWDGSYATGASPISIELGDFTGDGKVDVATTNGFTANNLSVLYGGGDGTFSNPVNSAVGTYAYGLAVGDFNRDGWLDAAVTNPTGEQHQVFVLINDQAWPPPPVSVHIDDAMVTEGHAGTVTANFAVTLSSDPAAPMTVNFSTADGWATTADGDYQSQSGTLTFNPGGPRTQTVQVLVNGDRRGESNETFFVNITSTAVLIADGQGIGMILDDEPRVSISDASVTEGHSGTKAVAFTVSLWDVYDAPVTVNYATQDGSATTADNDYVAASGSVTFAAGDTSQTITVLVKGDLLVEPDETFFVNLNSTTAVVVDGQGAGVILTDDATKFYVVDDASDKTFEYGATGQAVENYSLAWGNNDPRGAASDASGQRVWVVDKDKYIDVYDAAGKSLGYWYAQGLKTPEGIASNGTDIWIVDRGSDRVYRYAGAASRTSGSASPSSSFSLASGNREAKGIETDGKYLWVVDDASTNKVFKYTLAGALVGNWTISGANTSPTGITLDPSNPSDIWIVDAGRDQVFQYTAAAGRISGSQSPSAVFNLAPGNTNPQGIADPPPPQDSAPRLTDSRASGAPSRIADNSGSRWLEERASTLDLTIVPSPIPASARFAPLGAGDDTRLVARHRARMATAHAPAKPLTTGIINSAVIASHDSPGKVVHLHHELVHDNDALFADCDALEEILQVR
jgi:hypothetical protein